MVQLLKQIDDEVYHVVYHQEECTLFVREGVARKEPAPDSDDMLDMRRRAIFIISEACRASGRTESKIEYVAPCRYVVSCRYSQEARSQIRTLNDPTNRKEENE
ncbi:MULTISPECIES: hypothetical protein [Exiguobacterium]|uniref:hypothetical protein n=1 Tax=Exiguobacterium TaxID=33986 RepID=UPI001BEAEC88|nr:MULTISPECIES: hypothetical protein [Exiguobacterium]MCT4793474.1 hypothetical protein [Exiguobacterium artemiae]